MCIYSLWGVKPLGFEPTFSCRGGFLALFQRTSWRKPHNSKAFPALFLGFPFSISPPFLYLLSFSMLPPTPACLWGRALDDRFQFPAQQQTAFVTSSNSLNLSEFQFSCKMLVAPHRGGESIKPILGHGELRYYGVEGSIHSQILVLTFNPIFSFFLTSHFLFLVLN